MTKATEPQKAPKMSPSYKREKDNRMVKGRFIFHELPGGVLEFNFRGAHRGEKTQKYTMIDGEIYTLPLQVARHLNQNVSYPEYEHAQGEEFAAASNMQEGTPMRVRRMVRRCSFEPLDFIADEELQRAQAESDVVQVESA